MYTKSHKNRDADPPPLVPREVCHRRSRPREGRRRRRRWDASEHHSGGRLWDPLPRVGLPDPPSSRSLRASAAYRASRNRCCHWAWGPSPPLVRFRSVTVAQSWEFERHRWSPSLGRHRHRPPGSPSLTRPRKLTQPPSLKPNPWRPRGVFIVTRTWCG
jgi:hypothetical protein